MSNRERSFRWPVHEKAVLRDFKVRPLWEHQPKKLNNHRELCISVWNPEPWQALFHIRRTSPQCISIPTAPYKIQYCIDLQYDWTHWTEIKKCLPSQRILSSRSWPRLDPQNQEIRPWREKSRSIFSPKKQSTWRTPIFKIPKLWKLKEKNKAQGYEGNLTWAMVATQSLYCSSVMWTS